MQAIGIFDVLIVLLALLGAGIYLYGRSNRRQVLLERAKTEVARRGTGANKQKGIKQVKTKGLGLLLRLGNAVPLLNESQRQEASSKLVNAGYRSNQALILLIGLTVLSVGLVVAAVLWFGGPFLQDQGPGVRVGALLAAAYLGTMLPRLVLDRLVAKRQERLRLALPDALDLMVICTNAGLALGAALDRVADELGDIYPDLADEFKLTATELKLSSDVERVLNGLAVRTDIEGTRTLVSTFIQARKYGTAITQALRILAKTERTARMMRLEEAAAKLAVKMTVPMMVFILPTVIIVSAGPAAINIMKTFGNM